MANRPTVHERLPRLLVDLEEVFEAGSNDPLRFTLWKMKNAAWAALDGGMLTAAEVIDAAKALKRDSPPQPEKPHG